MEGEATRLCVYFEFAETEGYEIPDSIVEFVENVFEEYGLYPERIDDYNIYSEYFPDSDANMEALDEIERRFEKKFQPKNIDRHTVTRERYGVPPGAYQSWISINGLPEGLESEARISPDDVATSESEDDSVDHVRADPNEEESRRTAQYVGPQDQGPARDEIRECPGCGSMDLVANEKQGETICESCGLVVADKDEPGRDWSEYEFDSERDIGRDRSSWESLDDFNRELEHNDVDNSPPFETVTVGVIREPERTQRKYYRIEDAGEFFDDCWADDASMLRRIEESGIEPFEVVELPQTNWDILASKHQWPW
jgi:uncharacterized Zn finger protein (UPF0148 family)